MRDVSDRHPSVQEKAMWLTPNPNLPAGSPATVAGIFEATTEALLAQVGDGPQLTIGLQHLIDAKDAIVRQGIADQRQRGQGAHD